MKHDLQPAAARERAQANDARQAVGQTASALEGRLRAIDAVYRRFGREGLKDYPLCEVTLLLESKRLELRDAPSGRDVGEPQKAANRLLALEIHDLSGHVDALLSGAGLTTLRRTESRANARADRRDPPAGDAPARRNGGLDRGA